jgi:hypothetical protein
MSLQRIRTIKPEFFVNEQLARVSLAARLLYIGLWTVADREGRLEDRPARLKALLFPYDAVDVDRLLAELAREGFVRRYLVEACGYLDIPTFSKHQRPTANEISRNLPKCTEISLLALAKFSAGTGTGKEREGNGKGLPRSLCSLGATAGGDAGGFDQFWTLYPRKEKKRDARKAWDTLAPTPELVARILAALTWQRDNPRWREDQGRYVPHPASYLNGRRWEDEPATLKLFGTTAKTSANMASIKAGLGLEHDRRGS